MTEQKNMEKWQQLKDSTVEAYEQYLVPLLFAPGAEYLTQLAALESGDRVLDVACGTGSVARCAARLVGADGRVAGLDVSESMLKVARKVSMENQPAIEWKRGDVHDIPFPNAVFDVVFCQQALQFFSDQSAALREMHRVLAPNGRLALSVLRAIEHNPGWALLANVLDRHAGPEAGVIMRSAFPKLSADELRNLITGAGFRDVQIIFGIGPVRYPSVEEFFQWEVNSWLLAEPFASLKDHIPVALIRDLTKALEVYIDDNGIIFPAETYLVTGRR